MPDSTQAIVFGGAGFIGTHLLALLAGSGRYRRVVSVDIGEPRARVAGVELHPLVELDGLRTIASMTFDGHGPSILPATMLSPHLRASFVALPIENIAKRRVVLATRRFGFPSAPVRAIHSLLEDVVANAKNPPEGVYLPSHKTPA